LAIGDLDHKVYEYELGPGDTASTESRLTIAAPGRNDWAIVNFNMVNNRRAIIG
jgi:hypothetical protein